MTTYYVRSKDATRRYLGLLAILPTEWTKIELSEEAIPALESMVSVIEYRTDPPGPVLNPSGKVWFPGFRSDLIDE